MSNTAWFHLSQERLLSKPVMVLYLLSGRLHCSSSILILLFHSTGAVAAQRMRESPMLTHTGKHFDCFCAPHPPNMSLKWLNVWKTALQELKNLEHFMHRT